MGQLYVYEPWPASVDNMGLCGPLTPKKATCTQERNGEFRLDIEHPIDPHGKWTYLVPGNLVRANVPVRTLPQMAYGTTDPISRMYRATIKDVPRAERAVYPWYANGTTDMRLFTLDVGTTVYIVEVLTGISWPYANIRWPGGNGWILYSSLEVEDEDVEIDSPSVSSLESYIPAPRSRMQLFRIHSVKIGDSGVSVVARHVFYDDIANITSYTTTNTDAYTALLGLYANVRDNRIANRVAPDIQTNLTGTKNIAGWTRVPFVEAILSPSNGIFAYWGGEILRDNWVARIVTSAGLDQGYVIEYERNLKGITCEYDTSNLATAIMPVGQTTKGKPLIIPNTYYDPLVTIFYGVVYSPNDTGIPIPRIEVCDFGSSIKATGTSSSALNAAYAKLVRAALDKFEREKCDIPEVTLSVDFVNLGDTAEYAQYRDLQKLFLYDTVRVKNPRLGIDVTTQVNKTEWDCLLDRYNNIELGSVRKNYARTRVASWQVPGLETLSAYVDTISSAI